MNFRNFNDPLYKKWRLEVYKRDNFQCQWPNCASKKKLNAHHIYKWSEFPGLRFEANNGISLCKTHHDMIKNQEDIYAPIFIKILASKKNDK
jgi:predicted restriction endonuclease